jgi:hypothetical protein
MSFVPSEIDDSIASLWMRIPSGPLADADEEVGWRKWELDWKKMQ